tara:strand:- start:652 stop:1665 length:1014 start_codon:yes stop_codon:yes gene_type:complete
MKIEIAESLASSYLNHIEGCRIIQTNWKASSVWKIDQRLFEEAEAIYERIKSSPEFINVFKSKKNTFKQFIKQAEIDVLGINTSELRVYGLDIAFHSAGLNYSSQSQTVEEIVLKKLFRTALIMKIYFEQYDSFESIFVSPKINPSVQKKLDFLIEKAALILNNPTIEIKIVSNDNFFSEMVYPLIEKTKNENDISELFLRAYKLMSLDKGKEVDKNITFSPKIDNKPRNSSIKKEVNGMKIGQFVQDSFRKAYKRGLISEEEIKKLQDPEYSKRIFNANYEVLRFKTKSIEDHNKRSRYYKKELFCNSFYLSSQWYETQWENLLKWLKQIGYKIYH